MIDKDFLEMFAQLATITANMPIEISTSMIFSLLDVIAEANGLSRDDMKEVLDIYIKIGPEGDELRKNLFE